MVRRGISGDWPEQFSKLHDRGKLKTAENLAEVVSTTIGSRRGKIHPATRTFQALRIAVNRELDNLKVALEEIPLLLKSGGRFCIVSYHSLEDRAVKLSFRERKKQQHKWLVVTPKPFRPTAAEIKLNPRARSARMRVLEALSNKTVTCRGGSAHCV